MQDFFVYILECNDGSYYVGHTDNIEKRLTEHMTNTHSCYTSARLPVKLLFFKPYATRDEAFTAERQIKRWSRKKKEALIQGDFKALSSYSKKIFKH